MGLKLKKAVDLMLSGSRLMLIHSSSAEKKWFIVPGGEVDHNIALNLIKRPDVKSSEDGLFPGMPQTYRIKE